VYAVTSPKLPSFPGNQNPPALQRSSSHVGTGGRRTHAAGPLIKDPLHAEAEIETEIETEAEAGIEAGAGDELTASATVVRNPTVVAAA